MSTGLTPTQRFVLDVAARSSRGLVGFAAGDRLGTRVGWHDDGGRPWIIAYGTPAFFLMSRGLLAPVSNHPHLYQITDAGRDVLKPKRARA